MKRSKESIAKMVKTRAANRTAASAALTGAMSIPLDGIPPMVKARGGKKYKRAYNTAKVRVAKPDNKAIALALIQLAQQLLEQG